MTSENLGVSREKVTTKLTPHLRTQLKIRAAQYEVDIQDAVAEGVTSWRSVGATLPKVDTAGAESFSTWLPLGAYDRFKRDCAVRGVSYIQGLAQAIDLWLDMHPSPGRSAPSGIPQRKVVCNQKGGVGKTAIANGLGQALAESEEHDGSGLRVLMVDYDPQGHLSKHLGVTRIPSGEESLAKHMAGEAKGDIRDLIVPIEDDRFGGRLHILPSCADGFLLGVKLSQVRARESALERALEPLEAEYDAIVIDCPPTLGLEMDAAIYYGRRRDAETSGVSGVVIPVQAEDTSADAYTMLTDQIEDLRDDLRVDVEYLGLVVNLYDARRGFIATSSLEHWHSLGDPPVLAVLPDRKEQREAVRLKRPLLAYAPDCEQSRKLRALAREIS